MMDYLMQAYEVADEIKASTEYKNMLDAITIVETKYKDLIDAFNHAKNKYYTVLDEGGKYHPDYLESVKNLGFTKKNLYEKEEVIQYFQLEQKIQKMLHEFTIELTETISNNIKKPNELGLLKEKGGGCHANK